MQQLPHALSGFATYRQFVVCQFVPKPNGKTDKIPLDVSTMLPGSIHDQSIHMEGAAACAVAASLGDAYGVGFVFTVDDPFFFVDVDGCIDDDGHLNAVAQELLDATPGAAVERSHSGRGIHIFGTGTFGGHKKRNIPLGIEFYTELRFAALTGLDAQGNCTVDCTRTLTPVITKYFPPETSVAGDSGESYTTAPRPEWDGPTDDDLLIAKMMSSGSAAAKFSSTKASFADLFTANEAVLGAAYPDTGGKGRAYDASLADAALAQHLAFWTGCHEERMDRIMRRSALLRDKWDQRADYYLPRTIKGATARQEKVYSKSKHSTPGPAPGPVQYPAPTIAAAATTIAVTQDTPGVQFMSVEAQKEFFKDYVYVAELDQVFTPENGRLYRQSQFKNMFSNYTFALDSNNAKTTTNAWQAFCSSQGVRFKKVHDVEFRADFPEGNIRSVRGDLILNTYLDRRGKQIAGDPAPFLDLLAKMLPVREDQIILLSYMAAVVQHMGVKFRYCPVVQGVEGNGKSTMFNIMEYAVGERYCHKPSANGIVADGGKFNAWMAHTVLIGVEDIHIDAAPGGAFDAMKPLITNERIEVQSKGRDQKTGDNRGNWYISVNRQGDVPISDTSRRYCMFFTAQQEAGDKERDGMTDAYWVKFWDWMYGRAEGLEENYGFSVCHHLLATYPIPAKYNPALISAAPLTSSTQKAIVASRSELQQYISDAIDAEALGFRGGWVSSYHLDVLIESKRIRRGCSPNKRKELMRSLGYMWHPVLQAGRVTTPIEVEGNRRSVLYIKFDHLAALNMTHPMEVRDAYLKAQGYLQGTEVFAQRTAAK